MCARYCTEQDNNVDTNSIILKVWFAPRWIKFGGGKRWEGIFLQRNRRHEQIFSAHKLALFGPVHMYFIFSHFSQSKYSIFHFEIWFIYGYEPVFW